MADTNGTTAAAAPADPPPAPAPAPAADAPTSSTAAAAAAAAADKPESPADAGGRKPRDARLIHLMLANQGVTAYQERVPLMLMDFAYRYTSGVLQDALLFSDAINGTANTGGQNPPAEIRPSDLHMSIASRTNHQFVGALPKEFLLDIAAERNRVALPTVGPEFGVRLPPEKYCLTGVNWELKEGLQGWGDDDEDEDEDAPMVEAKVERSTEEAEDRMDVEEAFVGNGDVDSSMVDA